MRGRWTRLKRFLSNLFRRRRAGREHSGSPGRCEKVLDQMAALGVEIDEIKRGIKSHHAEGRSSHDPTVSQRLIRARDLRYKARLLRAELMRSFPDARIESAQMARRPASSPRGRIGMEELETMLESSDPRDRIVALRGLHNLPGPGCVPACLSCLADVDPKVRRTAATILGWRGSIQESPALTVLLRDEDIEVRLAAVEALGSTCSQQAVFSLIRALKDDENSVRTAAKVALERVIAAPVEVDVDGDRQVLCSKIEAMIRWWVGARVEIEMKEGVNE